MSALHSISGATDDDYCPGCARIICVCPPPLDYFTDRADREAERARRDRVLNSYWRNYDLT